MQCSVYSFSFFITSRNLFIAGRESQDDVDTPMEPETNGNDEETIVDTTRPRQVLPSENLQNYRSEAARLESFWNWTHRYPMPADLASAGFVFTGKLDDEFFDS